MKTVNCCLLCFVRNFIIFINKTVYCIQYFNLYNVSLYFHFTFVIKNRIRNSDLFLQDTLLLYVNMANICRYSICFCTCCVFCSIVADLVFIKQCFRKQCTHLVQILSLFLLWFQIYAPLLKNGKCLVSLL